MEGNNGLWVAFLIMTERDQGGTFAFIILVLGSKSFHSIWAKTFVQPTSVHCTMVELLFPIVHYNCILFRASSIQHGLHGDAKEPGQPGQEEEPGRDFCEV
jgi:hypothetical protein